MYYSILGLFIGIMEKKMEPTIMGLGSVGNSGTLDPVKLLRHKTVCRTVQKANDPAKRGMNGPQTCSCAVPLRVWLLFFHFPHLLLT